MTHQTVKLTVVPAGSTNGIRDYIVTLGTVKYLSGQQGGWVRWINTPKSGLLGSSRGYLRRVTSHRLITQLDQAVSLYGNEKEVNRG